MCPHELVNLYPLCSFINMNLLYMLSYFSSQFKYNSGNRRNMSHTAALDSLSMACIWI